MLSDLISITWSIGAATASLLAERTNNLHEVTQLTVVRPCFDSFHLCRTVLFTYNTALMLNLVGNAQSYQDGGMRMGWVGLMANQQTWGCNVQGDSHTGYIRTSAESDLSMTDPLLNSLSRASFSSLALVPVKEKSGNKWPPTKGHNNSITYNLAMRYIRGECSQRTKYNHNCNYLVPTNNWFVWFDM